MTLRKLIYLVLAASLVFFSACSDSTEPTEEPVDEFALVTTVGDVYFSDYSTANTSISAVYDNLTDGDDSNNPYIIDLRSADDYAAKHIQGAVNISLGSLMDKVDDGTIPDDQAIVTVCYTGQTASVAASVLNLLGYSASNMLFGMCGVTSDPAVVPKSDRWINKVNSSNWYTLDDNDEGDAPEQSLPKLSTGKKSAVDIIKARFVNAWDWNGDGNADWGMGVSALPDDLNNYFIVNYWPAAEYLNPGHIEGAYQYTPKVDLLSDAKLNTLPTDQKIAVYCYTGQTSAQLTAYLRILGYEAYSVTYGVNGFAYDQMTKSKYTEPTGDYSAILE